MQIEAAMIAAHSHDKFIYIYYTHAVLVSRSAASIPNFYVRLINEYVQLKLYPTRSWNEL